MYPIFQLHQAVKYLCKKYYYRPLCFLNSGVGNSHPKKRSTGVGQLPKVHTVQVVWSLTLLKRHFTCFYSKDDSFEYQNTCVHPYPERWRCCFVHLSVSTSCNFIFDLYDKSVCFVILTHLLVGPVRLHTSCQNSCSAERILYCLLLCALMPVLVNGYRVRFERFAPEHIQRAYLNSKSLGDIVGTHLLLGLMLWCQTVSWHLSFGGVWHHAWHVCIVMSCLKPSASSQPLSHNNRASADLFLHISCCFGSRIFVCVRYKERFLFVTLKKVFKDHQLIHSGDRL